MVTPDEEHDHYIKDPRMPCQFGGKCYQKNSAHHEKYKHPPKRRPPKDGSLSENVFKRFKFESEAHSSNATNNLETEAPKEAESKAPKEAESKVPKEAESKAPKQRTPENFDKKLFIKEKFLFEMPNDFYEFWELCTSLKKEDPCKAFASVDLVLVGAYEVLAGKFSNVEEKSADDYLVHWRYFHDPPEFQTVIKGSDATQYHIGYFRDDPSELPSFLASNHAKLDGEFDCMGENIFAAVNNYLEECTKSFDLFKQMELGRLQSRLKARARELNLNFSDKTESIKKRNDKILSRTFNKLGLVVPYNKKTQVGYRHLSVSDKELRKLLDRVVQNSGADSSKIMSQLQPVFTATSIATDECDFGTGIELGWDILAHEVDVLNSTIERFLTTSYQLFERPEFAQIISAHMKNRKVGSNLSIL